MQNMPLHAFGWSSEEEEKLVEMIHSFPDLYIKSSELGRKNILAKDKRWLQISQELNKPLSECKKRWQTLKDDYLKSNNGDSSVTTHSKETHLKLEQMLGNIMSDNNEDDDSSSTMLKSGPQNDGQDIDDDHGVIEEAVCDENEVSEEAVGEEYTGVLEDGVEPQVKADESKYYIVTIQKDTPNTTNKPPLKILPKPKGKMQLTKIKQEINETGIKAKRRKRAQPMPTNTIPIKILPKPGASVFQPVKLTTLNLPDPAKSSLEILIEKILNESRNDVDIFFKSIAETVKQMHPSLVPKLKLEVCNVVSKYELQNMANMIKK